VGNQNVPTLTNCRQGITKDVKRRPIVSGEKVTGPCVMAK